jgi:hypothetical protein
MVGTTGFEPATSRTPSVRATRLRHVPTECEISVSPAFKKGQDGNQLFAKVEEAFALGPRQIVIPLTDRSLRRGNGCAGGFWCTVLFRQMAPCPGDGEALLIKKAFDFKYGFDVLPAVHAMAARAFYRLQRRKFRLPIAQHEGFRARQTADFADAEQTLLGNFGCGLRSRSHFLRVSAAIVNPFLAVSTSS